jgi:hypothetical protein
MVRSLVLLGCVVILCGCAAPQPINPAFDIKPNEARCALRDMSRQPTPLQRPLVIVGGYLDPSVSGTLWKHRIRRVTDGPVIDVVVGFYGNFDDCRKRVIEAVEAAFPSDDPAWTREVDVIGVSLGGLVARYAAAPLREQSAGKRLKIARLFTIGSPHKGARLATVATLNQLHSDMVPGSPFMKYLEAMDGQARYEIYPYVCLGDSIVGQENAAPPGRQPLWLAGRAIHFLDPHRGSWHDQRITADIARRLRGEEAWSH